ncbi:metal ABC transporter substrate-binding protein [Luteolibacter sp. SL250]|uniref:metal ABC transporter substrate-binding protein n=1 Tax=Luteolibacter sp. SL250 TaxID=2995170 RepID=UPI00227094C2|nr:metal ABC transporter substrate-binding protein [Luteolibacter sp. SL250]WAC18014.1 metal ABC transporter substrate-binding protein [Luteolibacter sp. SL250]
MRPLLLSLLFSLASATAAELKVAVLHPLLADITKSVGGERVEVIDLIGPNGDPHHFEPSTESLTQSDGAKLYLVAGMGLEGYLPKLKTIVGGKATVVEVGATLPALEGECDHDHDGHDHDHKHGLDPHWWHSIDLFRRATNVVADSLSTADPAGAEDFRKNAAAYRGKLDELERWTKKEVARVPRERRHLATAHAAFNYFCKDFGFTAHPVQGINREQMPGPKELSKLISDLKEHQVAAIFPEKESNPKILQTLTKDTGIKLAGPLIADGTGVASYEEMVKHNVTVIVTALKPE